MTQYPSYPSPPWLGVRKIRATTPRSTHDYNLLAATVACFPIPSETISRKLGFEDIYAKRLSRSTAGNAFIEWLCQQPDDFIKRFRDSVNNRVEPGTQIEENSVPDAQPPTRLLSAEEAFASLLWDLPADALGVYDEIARQPVAAALPDFVRR